MKVQNKPEGNWKTTKPLVKHIRLVKHASLPGQGERWRWGGGMQRWDWDGGSGDGGWEDESVAIIIQPIILVKVPVM